MTIIMKKDYKKEALRCVLRNVLKESENIRGFEFVEMPKDSISDIVPADVYELMSSSIKQAEKDSSQIVFDKDKNIIAIKTNEGAFLYQGKGIVDMTRLLDDLFKSPLDKSSLEQMGFTSI